MAILVISCMLACAVSPVVTTWSNDASDVTAHGGDDDAFVYVSLGDSMVSGFGMIDYYEEGTGKNTFGFEKTNGEKIWILGITAKQIFCAKQYLSFRPPMRYMRFSTTYALSRRSKT